MTTCQEESPKEGQTVPTVHLAKILTWLHYMYKMNKIPIELNGIYHTFMKNGKAIKPPDFK